MLGVQSIEPRNLVWAVQLAGGALRQSEEICGVGALRLGYFAVFGQALERVFADHLKHGEARLFASAQLRLQQALFEERGQPIEDRGQRSGIRGQELTAWSLTPDL